ncbi:MAG: YtxH domain-containing protein [Eubacteriales bacterium]|nr:YtxH domain-containing protein [Eubacteriales bacterium]MDD3350227.1 YtxH domain-containing protein [Eubacteriales bacterium]
MGIGLFVGLVIGGGVGFLYYKLVGCPTGACPITSNPYSATIYGAVLGSIIGGAV